MEFFDWRARFPGHEVYNLGSAGETVEGLLSRIGGIIKRYAPPDLIFIMTGINNVAMEDYGFLESYRNIVRKLSAAYPETGIYLHSLLPTRMEWISNDTIQRLNRSLKEAARDAGAEYLDLYAGFIDREGKAKKDYLLDDGVHLSNEGYAVWSGIIEPLIKR